MKPLPQACQLKPLYGQMGYWGTTTDAAYT